MLISTKREIFRPRKIFTAFILISVILFFLSGRLDVMHRDSTASNNTIPKSLSLSFSMVCTKTQIGM